MAPDLIVTRMGYGAMQLAGPGVFGPPEDRDEAVAVLREAVERGITHIDTSDYYGPFVTNEIIREALHPYPASLHIVTKVGARRDADGGWPHARSPEDLRRAVHENLRPPGPGRARRRQPATRRLQRPRAGVARRTVRRARRTAARGLDPPPRSQHRVSAEQIDEAQSIAPIVCVQNFYNVAHRADDELIDSLAAQGIAYVPYFPLGGFTTLQSDELASVATRLDVTSLAVALAWLLQRSSNILLIPGTSSRAHLRENIAGAAATLSAEDLAELDRIAA